MVVACHDHPIVTTYAHPSALLVLASLVVVLTDARPAALLALASLEVVLAYARPAALLELTSLAVVLADARPAALLAPASSAVVVADARPAALLAAPSLAVVLADARPSAAAASCYFSENNCHDVLLMMRCMFVCVLRPLWRRRDSDSGLDAEGTCFTCFTGTKLQILMLLARLAPPHCLHLLFMWL